MKQLLAGVLAVCLAGSVAGFAPVSAEPDDPWSDPAPAPVGDAATAVVVYAVGGARGPGIPWYEYTVRSGSGYFPNARREIIDYPAGASYSWVPDLFGPHDSSDNTTIGSAVSQAASSLDRAIRGRPYPAAVVGLSQGSLALDQEQVLLANDPTAPPPSALTFTTFGDPAGRHAFGASFLAGIFPPGSYIPVIDYTMPQPVDSQYDTVRVVTAYDGIADFPDRPDNLLAVANAFAALVVAHTPAAFTSPSDVPPQNINATVNSRGATTTTYLIPLNHLPLTLPLRYLGMSDGQVDGIDAFLQPQIDSGYSRNDNPLTRPASVDPVQGMDPIAILDPATRDSIEGAFSAARGVIGPFN